MSKPVGVRNFFPKRLGIYLDGKVSCRQGEWLVKRMFTVEGKPTGAGDMERYRDGWDCGGQMGTFVCLYPYSRGRSATYTREVLALDCTDHQNGGCPTTAKMYWP